MARRQRNGRETKALSGNARAPFGVDIFGDRVGRFLHAWITDKPVPRYVARGTSARAASHTSTTSLSLRYWLAREEMGLGEMAVWIMSLTQPLVEHPDLASAMRALQETLDDEKAQGMSVRPDRVTDAIGTVYTVRGEAGIEQYWLSTDPPPE